MKSIFKISLFALALILVQACGSKKENADAAAEVSTPVLTAEEQAAQDKKEAKEKREAAQQERLRIAAERRAAAEAFYKDNSGDMIYNKVEVAPSFTGGVDAMNQYFKDNLKYPKEAEAKGWDGTVYVEFVVGRDGKVRGATVTDETDADADQTLKDEAIRVVNNMPKWVPGRQQGKAVHAKFNLPIAFQLQP